VWFELREYAEARGQGSDIIEKNQDLDNSLKKDYPNPNLSTRPPRFQDAVGQGGVRELGFEQMEPRKYKRVILKQEFVGANQVRPVGRERLSWNSNFFYGNDSSKWCVDVPNYNEIYYENLYDGIDLRYYTNEKGLKYDFIVHPGANAKQIAVRYDGAEGITIVDGSNLIIETKISNLLDAELCIYQKYNGKKHQINGNFLIINEMEYGFDIQDEYNNHEDLIIDPVLMYSTYVGDTGEESARDLEVDSNGYAYITGGTTSSNFPVTAGAYNPSYTGSGDVFVMKLSANGSEPVYSTFVGGASGERGWAIAIDSTGNAYVAGRSWGSGFPVTSGVYDDTFNGGLYDLHVFKLNSMGSDLLFSTYLGGSQNDGPREIEVDMTGNVSVIGDTNSTNFPTTLGAYNRTLQSRSDVFVSKLTNDGSKLIGSTFIGGNHDDIGGGITTDSEGNLYCISYTRSTDFPATPNAYSTKNNGIYDATIFKFNENASKLIYSTYIGGSSTDAGFDIELDNTGCVYGIGYTYSTDFPTTNGAYDASNNGEFDCFIVKLNQTGSKLLYSTYLGGSGSDTALKLALDSDRNVYIAGSPGSNDFPITPGCLNYSFSKNIFITVFNLTCSNVLYSTFFGGESYDILGGIALDPNNNIYVAGQTESTKFPVTPGVLGPSYGGARDGYVSKIQCKPEINITSLELLKDGEPVETIYSCLCPYTFRITFTRILLQTDIQVHLNLDPLNTNLQLLWNSSTGKFIEISDPDNVITLEPSSYAYNSTWFEWTLDFNITFNWTYPDEELNDVQIIASSLAKNYAWLNKTNFYRIENDLNFLGFLSVRDESNRQIENNDLVRGGMELTWMGLKVTYENTTDIYPLAEEFDITLWDESNNSWSDSPATGGYFMIQTITDSKTNLLGVTYTINITSIPPECDKTDESFIIRIDGDNVTFSNPTPDNTTWQTFSNVGVGIHIKDINGAGINSASIMNCFSTDNGGNWSEWEGISGLEPNPAMFLDVESIVTLEDGTDNLVKWRARDFVGNGPNESDAYRIMVDTQNIIFSNPKPLITEESAFENVEVGINISDLTSGVDSTTVEYIISTNMGLTWGPWTSVTNLENGNNIDIKLNLTFPNGSANRIKWRALDLAGNGPTESIAYIIKVNTWKPSLPKVNLISPENGTTLYVPYVKLEWSLVNTKLSGITYDIILDTKYPPTEVKQEDHPYTNFVPQNIQDETTYYWTIIPKLDSESGFCNSGIWSFTINTSVPVPSVQLISPLDGAKEKSVIIKFEWELLYDGTDDATYQIFIWDPEGTVNITENITFNNYFLDVYAFNIEYKMYFWKVIPRTQTIIGLESETWTFYFESPGPTPEFEIKLSLTPSAVQLKPGENTSAVLSVTNLGEQTDRISINIQPLSSSIITIT
jgi:hypothetical protein